MQVQEDPIYVEQLNQHHFPCSILQSNNGLNKTIENLAGLSTPITVHGKPRNCQSQRSVEKANQDMGTVNKGLHQKNSEILTYFCEKSLNSTGQGYADSFIFLNAKQTVYSMTVTHGSTNYLQF